MCLRLRKSVYRKGRERSKKGSVRVDTFEKMEELESRRLKSNGSLVDKWEACTPL